MGDVRWLAVLPLKPPEVAKSRLRGALPGVPHPDLVVAMMLDTAAAALGCPRIGGVVVVCDEPAVRVAAEAIGAGAVPDRPAAGLNAAVAFGASVAPALRRSGTRTPVLALTADLPALRPAELTGALDAAGRVAGPAFVPDAGGTGTVLLAAPSATDLVPAFGTDSAAAHEAAGARRLTGAWPGLRRDVDVAADLLAAARLGLGRRTAVLLTAAGYPGSLAVPARSGAGTVVGMGTLQGTVATFDVDTGAGTALLDDGSEVGFPPPAFAASGLRLLRLGQRVRLERAADGSVVRVTLVTLP